MDMDEVADVAEPDAVVTITNRTGHDQPKRDGLPEIGCVPDDKEPVKDEDRRNYGQHGEHLAPEGEISANPPECPGVVAGPQLQHFADDRDCR